MMILTDVTDEMMSKTFDIPLYEIKAAKSYKQLSATNKEIIVAKRDEETNLWKVKFYDE